MMMMMVMIVMVMVNSNEIQFSIPLSMSHWVLDLLSIHIRMHLIFVHRFILTPFFHRSRSHGKCAVSHSQLIFYYR